MPWNFLAFTLQSEPRDEVVDPSFDLGGHGTENELQDNWDILVVEILLFFISEVVIQCQIF
jgi:hypothetical protein